MTQKFNPYKTFAHDGKALSQYKEVPLWECPKCGGKVDTRMDLVRDHKCPEEEKTQTQTAKQELAQAIDEAYQAYANAYYRLNATSAELDALWQTYQALTEQVAC